MITFEVGTVSLQAINVSFEHPCGDNVTTGECILCACVRGWLRSTLRPRHMRVWCDLYVHALFLDHDD